MPQQNHDLLLYYDNCIVIYNFVTSIYMLINSMIWLHDFMMQRILLGGIILSTMILKSYILGI